MKLLYCVCTLIVYAAVFMEVKHYGWRVGVVMTLVSVVSFIAGAIKR